MASPSKPSSLPPARVEEIAQFEAELRERERQVLDEFSRDVNERQVAVLSEEEALRNEELQQIKSESTAEDFESKKQAFQAEMDELEESLKNEFELQRELLRQRLEQVRMTKLGQKRRELLNSEASDASAQSNDDPNAVPQNEEAFSIAASASIRSVPPASPSSRARHTMHQDASLSDRRGSQDASLSDRRGSHDASLSDRRGSQDASLSPCKVSESDSRGSLFLKQMSPSRSANDRRGSLNQQMSPSRCGTQHLHVNTAQNASHSQISDVEYIDTAGKAQPTPQAKDLSQCVSSEDLQQGLTESQLFPPSPPTQAKRGFNHESRTHHDIVAGETVVDRDRMAMTPRDVTNTWAARTTRTPQTSPTSETIAGFDPKDQVLFQQALNTAAAQHKLQGTPRARDFVQESGLRHEIAAKAAKIGYQSRIIEELRAEIGTLKQDRDFDASQKVGSPARGAANNIGSQNPSLVAEVNAFTKMLKDFFVVAQATLDKANSIRGMLLDFEHSKAAAEMKPHYEAEYAQDDEDNDTASMISAANSSIDSASVIDDERQPAARPKKPKGKPKYEEVEITHWSPSTYADVPARTSARVHLPRSHGSVDAGGSGTDSPKKMMKTVPPRVLVNSYMKEEKRPLTARSSSAHSHSHKRKVTSSASKTARRAVKPVNENDGAQRKPARKNRARSIGSAARTKTRSSAHTQVGTKYRHQVDRLPSSSVTRGTSSSKLRTKSAIGHGSGGSAGARKTADAAPARRSNGRKSITGAQKRRSAPRPKEVSSEPAKPEAAKEPADEKQAKANFGDLEAILTKYRDQIKAVDESRSVPPKSAATADAAKETDSLVNEGRMRRN